MPFEKENKVGKQFQPGASGNPGGRPKSLLSKVRESLEIYGSVSPEMAKITVSMARNKKLEPKERYLFIRDIQDRAMGKPHTNSEEEIKKIREELKELKEFTTQQMSLILAGKVEESIKLMYQDGRLKHMIEKWDADSRMEL